jgi:AraC-like DNA-binding protein
MLLARLLGRDRRRAAIAKVARDIADEYFEVSIAPSTRVAQLWSQGLAPHVMCWDFEDTQAVQLRTMRDFKGSHPVVPILMLTTRHWEELAVWAFRARVWNYVVKPVASELRANFGMLAQLVADSGRQPRSVRFLRTFLPRDVDEEAPRDASVKAAVAHVEQHYAEKLCQIDVARTCGMNSCQFSRAFKFVYGMTYRDYLIRSRVSRACRLLRRRALSRRCGDGVGFEDPSHFARAFRRLLGVSPSAYQRKKPPLRPKIEPRRRTYPAIGLGVRATPPPPKSASIVLDP